jgi:hypothetical protein
MSISRVTSWGSPSNLDAKNRWGKYCVSFLPAISAKAAKTLRATIRTWKLASTRNNQRLEDLAEVINPAVIGWMNYYGRFYRSRLAQVLRHLNDVLGPGFDGNTNIGTNVVNAHPCIGFGASPDEIRNCSLIGSSGFDRRLDRRSRMKRECHGRFCETEGCDSPPPLDSWC